jgi:hypothetical protein
MNILVLGEIMSRPPKTYTIIVEKYMYVAYYPDNVLLKYVSYTINSKLDIKFSAHDAFLE